MIVNKDIKEITQYLEELGIVDKGYFSNIAEAENRYEVMGAVCRVFKQHEDKKVEYSFNIYKDLELGLFKLENYYAKMLKLPEIDHAIFGHIDTRELEQRMAKVDWNLGAIPFPGNSRLSNAFYDLIDLVRLDDKKAIEIAEVLIVKYWSDTAMRELVNYSIGTAEYEKRMSFPLNMDTNDVEEIQAFNILDGRSVMKFENPTEQNTDVYWIKEKDGQLVTFPDFDLSGILKKLSWENPPNELTGPEIILEMMAGNRVPAIMKAGKEPVQTFIECEAENATITLYNESGKQMDLSGFVNKESTKRQSIKKPAKRKGKGRSL